MVGGQQSVDRWNGWDMQYDEVEEVRKGKEDNGWFKEVIVVKYICWKYDDESDYRLFVNYCIKYVCFMQFIKFLLCFRIVSNEYFFLINLFVVLEKENYYVFF